jgi:sigma-B regulation protein RsbU (phosphoserine phosphatase)
MSISVSKDFLGHFQGRPDEQLAYVVDMMREISRQTDPQRMVQTYGARVRKLLKTDRFMSLSRRELAPPYVRITRSDLFDNSINPWRDRDQLPLLNGGLLSELIWGDVPVVIDDLQVDPDDPAYRFLDGMRSLVAIPLYDQGTALNMIVTCRNVPNGFDREFLAQHVWMSNLFGRATHSLVLSQELRKAYEAVDTELQTVADIQQSLLPTSLPTIPTLDLAVHYQTSKRAGGDYYDFFPLPDGRWGILIADVSGHGTPAAVIMAVTHSIAHTLQGPAAPPSRLLEFVNEHLTTRYTGNNGTFVTAFYGIYDPAMRTITYASAGHCPPRIKRAGDGILCSLDKSRQLPLGIETGDPYEDVTATLRAGDSMLLYTDGITESRNVEGEFYGTSRLDEVLLRTPECATAAQLLAEALRSVRDFANGRAATDDRTLLAIKVN